MQWTIFLQKKTPPKHAFAIILHYWLNILLKSLLPIFFCLFCFVLYMVHCHLFLWYISLNFYQNHRLGGTPFFGTKIQTCVSKKIYIGSKVRQQWLYQNWWSSWSLRMAAATWVRFFVDCWTTSFYCLLAATSPTYKQQ